jgi:hypothetical protein
MKRIVSAAALVILAATAVSFTAVAAPSTTTARGKTVTLRLVTKDVASNYVDNPPRQGNNAPPLMGDQFTLTDDVLTRSGKHAGIFAATCTVARGGVNPFFLCHGIYALKGGLITGIARAGNSNTTHVAIVGGTGAYEGVTGSSVEIARNESTTDVTIHLIYP